MSDITSFELNTEIDGSNPFTSFSGFTLVQSCDWHHHFELRAPLDDIEKDENDPLNKSKDFIGKSIKIEIKHAGGKGDKHAFNGVITDISIERHGGRGADLILKGYSPTIVLEHGPNSKIYSKQNLSGIVNSATSKYPKDGINYKVNPSPNPTREMTIQYKESAYNFLARLANQYGQWFFFDGKDCVFGGLPSSKAIELDFGSNLYDFQLDLKIGPTKFSAKAYDYINNKAGSADGPSPSGLDHYGKIAFNKSENYFFESQTVNPSPFIKDQGELNDFAKARRAAIAAQLVTLTGQTNDLRLKPGAQVSVKSAGMKGGSSDFGSYTVFSITHSIDGSGNYRNNFEAIPASLSVPPPNKNVMEPNCETQAANVTHNADDQGMGRIKVKFYWSQDETTWIRTVAPNAGKNHGGQFLPEVGDDVLVTFENNNPDLPVVIGGMHHGKAAHSDRNDKDNHVKTIRTVSGNEIKFTDKGGEEEILIMNKETNNMILLSLKDDGKITIQSKGKIEMKAKEMSIEVEKDFTLKAQNINQNADQKLAIAAKQDATLEGLDVKFTAKKDLSIDATGGVKIKANTEFTVDGGLKGEIQTKAQLSLSSSGQTAVKGSVVMIN